MKINKKGFTLIELLAVIAILAILVVIAVPAVLNLFNSSKKSSFVSQAQSIYKAAEQKLVTAQLNPGTVPTIYCFVPAKFAGASNPEDSSSMVDLSKNNVAYKVTFDANFEKVTKIVVMDAKNYISLEDTTNGIEMIDIDETDIMQVSNSKPTSCALTNWPAKTNTN